MTYKKFIEDLIKEYEYGYPIYAKSLAHSLAEHFQLSEKKASAAVSVAIKRIIDEKKILEFRTFQKGVYYCAKSTPFGETGIRIDILIADKYLKDDSGYETGLSLLHHMGLTTQIPAQKVFATNKATECIRVDNSLGILICPPKKKINAENKNYLQVLDAIDMLKMAPIDIKNPFALIANHIHMCQLDYGVLLSIAYNCYSKNTVFTLAQIASESRLL